MKFFKLEDFQSFYPFTNNIVDIANEKLERVGKIVYSNEAAFTWRFSNESKATKALLINIESIEKCTHPEKKVEIVITEGFQKQFGQKLPVFQSEYYKCECGAKVKPTGFEEI